MKKALVHILLFFCFGIFLTSCKSTSKVYNYQNLAKASLKLGVDIDKRDNHKLYLEASEWIGVPYRYSGTTKKGVDCSGLTCHLYRNVYNKTLERSSEGQRKKDCHKIPRRKLREGDLVFFSTGRSKRQATHVGVYLKKNKFIHSSTSKGVIVSDLNEQYYKKNFLSAGRVMR